MVPRVGCGLGYLMMGIRGAEGCSSSPQTEGKGAREKRGDQGGRVHSRPGLWQLVHCATMWGHNKNRKHHYKLFQPNLCVDVVLTEMFLSSSVSQASGSHRS